MGWYPDIVAGGKYFAKKQAGLYAHIKKAGLNSPTTIKFLEGKIKCNLKRNFSNNWVALENNNTPGQALRYELVNLIKSTVAHDMGFEIKINNLVKINL